MYYWIVHLPISLGSSDIQTSKICLLNPDSGQDPTILRSNGLSVYHVSKTCLLDPDSGPTLNYSKIEWHIRLLCIKKKLIGSRFQTDTQLF